MRLVFSCQLVFAILLAGCSRPASNEPGSMPSSLSQVAAVRLNYRYEADVPAPDPPKDTVREERNPAVQANFDQNRPQEILDRTLTSPDGTRVLAIYHQAGDVADEFRLDMYTPAGGILKKVTADAMAVHFPDTIRWAPDSSTVAFVAMVRGATVDETATAPAPDPEVSVVTPNTNSAATDTNANADPSSAPPSAPPTPVAPTGILTFRTEQIYICDAEGGNTRPITQNEGLIYFYYVWSADSSALAALAVKSIEWRYLNDRAETAGEIFVPVGRPRVVEKNGRERRLDDGVTAVQPVWSPDSTKVACAFGDQVRIYDATATSPTQAAIPIRNHLLLSSQTYEREQEARLSAEPGANVNVAQPETLPDPEKLASFNPIVALNWMTDDVLYFQTAYIKRMKNEADSVTSFARWHRLVLSPQPAAAR